MRLSEYLGSARPLWDWRRLDCCRWVDAWVVASGWTSPMAAIGIQYDSELSAMRRIREGGGLGVLWADGMAAIGAPLVDETDGFHVGDVGVIVRPTTCGINEAAAIWTGERWVTLGLRGLDFGPAEALAVWHV